MERWGDAMQFITVIREKFLALVNDKQKGRVEMTRPFQCS